MNPTVINDIPVIMVSTKAMNEALDFVNKKVAENTLYFPDDLGNFVLNMVSLREKFGEQVVHSVISTFLEKECINMPFDCALIKWFVGEHDDLEEVFEVRKNGDIRHYLYIIVDNVPLEDRYIGYYDESVMKLQLRKSLNGTPKGKKLLADILQNDMLNVWLRRFRTAMYYATNFKEYIITTPREHSDNPMPRKPNLNTTVVKSLHSKVFILPEKTPEPRSYTKPDHEVQVRGYYRTYKSGKQVWVSPCVKYAGKNKSKTTYEL